MIMIEVMVVARDKQKTEVAVFVEDHMSKHRHHQQANAVERYTDTEPNQQHSQCKTQLAIVTSAIYPALLAIPVSTP